MSIQTVEFSLKLVNLCKFTAWCLAVLTDNLHPQFDTKILSKKVRLIHRCLRYLNMKSISWTLIWELFLEASSFHCVLAGCSGNRTGLGQLDLSSHPWNKACFDKWLSIP